MTVDLIESSDKTRYTGSRVARTEDARLLTGEGRYVDDVQVPGTMHVVFVRSPFARARILSIDTSAAAAVDGVVAVLTAADINGGVHAQWHSAAGDVPETPRPPLADDEVRMVGDPVAMVIAESRYIAEDAAELVDIDYEFLPALVDYTQAKGNDIVVHDLYPDNVAGHIPGPPIDAAEAVYETAAHVVRETIVQHAYAAVPMETRGIITSWSRSTGEMTIWASTQVPHEIKMFCARLLDLPEHRIRVIVGDTGGGFGQKVAVLREDMCMMLAAPLFDHPLKWIEDRIENLTAAGKSRREQADVGMAFDTDGRFLAVSIDFLSDAGAYPSPAPNLGAAAVGALFPGPYKVPLCGFDTVSVYTNTCGRTAYRGPWQFESVAREVTIDIAARRMGLDPVELRRRNMLSVADLPYQNPTFFVFDNTTPLETFEKALEIIDYDEFRARQAEARADGRYLGIGTGTYIEPTTPGYGCYATEGARIRIEPSGRVLVFMNGGSAGNSIETTVTQMVADALGVGIDDVTMIAGDTSMVPYGAGTGGSRSGSMTAGAVAEATGLLRDRIVAIAAYTLDATPDSLELAGGKVSVIGDPESTMTLEAVAQIAYFAPNKLPAEVPAGLEVTGTYAAVVPNIFANATHVCTCEVDIATGAVTLLRYVVAEDCGPMINPNVVEGQIAGGTVQGIGGVLFEDMPYDDDGNPLATSFVDYLMPTAAEIPDIEYGHVTSMSPGPGGYKGVGEGGAIGAPPAVINAVADALAPLGVTITEQPLSPARLIAFIEDAQATS